MENDVRNGVRATVYSLMMDVLSKGIKISMITAIQFAASQDIH